MSRRSTLSPFPFRVAAIAAAAASAALLAAVRLSSVLSFGDDPFQGYTSGDEQASLFALWRWTQGLPVYGDRFQPPFNGVFFNWLFYAFYGSIADLGLRLFDLSDAWLPTIGRLTTMLGAVVFGLSFHMAASSSPGVRRDRASIPLISIFLAIGPLIGFWVATVRPDLWAAAAEGMAAALFLAAFRRRPMAAVALAALFCWLAWSFKQANVTTVGAVGLFLLVRRRWMETALFCTLVVGGWGAVLLLGSEPYLRSVLFAGFPLFYEMRSLVRNLSNMGGKTLGLWMTAAAIAAAGLDRNTRQALFADDRVLLGGCGVLVGLCVMGAASLQTGAGENYFFSLSFHLALAAAGGLSVLPAGPALRRAAAAAVVGWSATAGVAVLPVLGVAGVVDLGYMHHVFTRWKSCLDPVPRPLFVDNVYMSLPWMTPGTQPYVLSFLYKVERGMGKPFAGDGIGGLIERGAFAAIAAPAAEPPESIDGARLDGYIAVQDCDGLQVMLRRDLAEKRTIP